MSPASASMYANPYTNPMTNPFLNPYMAPFTQAGPQNLAMYMFAAQAASGGIGSGQISGVRPAPGTSRTSAASRTAASRASAAAADLSQRETAAVRTSDIPGAGASRYFGRTTQQSAGASPYFNRSGRYYSSKGH
jgi:hypothetical protein